MAINNVTGEIQFHFLGISVFMSTPIFSFCIILAIYIFNMLGNSVIIIVTKLDHQLHKPMYFFLSNLSLVDMLFTTVTLPKTLEILLSTKKNITFACCMVQMYFFLAVGVTESFLLALMSYDRYFAICNPLRYSGIMTNQVCIILVIGCWISGLLSVLLPVILISKLPFCQSFNINHFFCDVSPVIQLSCKNKHKLELFIFFTAAIVILGTFLIIVVSYICIIMRIVHIKTSTGKKKAFSTCVSHLMVVLIYYGTIIFMYVRPKSDSNLNMDKQTSVFYSVITPTLNPLIYSLRNEDIKNSIKKLGKKLFTSQ